MKIEAILDRIFKHKVIVNCDGDPYLFRWYVFRTRGIGLFIHKFVRSDEDRALHDHPWPFLVIPAWRGYIEHSEVDALPEVDPGAWMRGSPPQIPRAVRVLPVVGTRLRRATYRHRVELLRCDGKELPAWSLFFRFREWRTWGFWPKAGFVAWNKWWQDNKCG
jgi:hypothetical protein